MALPNMGSTFKKFELKSAADQLVYYMRYAQTRAVAKNILVRLEFSEDFSSYWLSGEELRKEDDVTIESTELIKISGRMGHVNSIPLGVKVKSDLSFVDFYPDGDIQKQVMNVCNDKLCYTVSTEDQRGYVRIYESNTTTHPI